MPIDCWVNFYFTPAADRRVIFFSVGNEIRQHIFYNKEFKYSEVVAEGERIEALDFDPMQKVLYWTDSSSGSFKRAMLPDDPALQPVAQTLSVNGIMQPNGIAFDWVTRWVLN
jgi:hypothetical protein